MKLLAFSVRNYRSLKNVTLKLSEDKPLVICGENNIGKTNFLRALNLFFNHLNDIHTYIPSQDIPHHIYYGSRGSGTQTTLTATILENKNSTVELKVIFGKDNHEVSYYKNKEEIDAEQFNNSISDIRFVFIESHNVNLPQIIAASLKNEGLLSLDRQRSRQTRPLASLQEFIRLSNEALKNIEAGINRCFSEFADFEGILKDNKVKIQFAEFEKLRDVIQTMTEITLLDGNNHSIASKGSGAQRALFLSLMKYISENTKGHIIWGVDEPEAFLQPKLQKRVAEVFDQIATEEHSIILTTHSPHFIKLSELEFTHLFKCEQTEKTYQRRKGQIFYEMNTAPIKFSTDVLKLNAIREHLGIANNDGWSLMPHSILVEGKTDQKYLETLYATLNMPLPNIISAEGVDNFSGLLRYYDHQAKNAATKPHFNCIFDNDSAGRTRARKIKPERYKNITISKKPLPRFNKQVRDFNENKGADWTIEEFFPPHLIFTAINKCLAQKKYKQISVSNQQAWETGKAFKDTQLLEYAEAKCCDNNPQKNKLHFVEDGIKQLICSNCCELISQQKTPETIFSTQKNFLEELLKK